MQHDLASRTNTFTVVADSGSKLRAMVERSEASALRRRFPSLGIPGKPETSAAGGTIAPTDRIVLRREFSYCCPGPNRAKCRVGDLPAFPWMAITDHTDRANTNGFISKYVSLIPAVSFTIGCDR
jgi:hypothetical protein